MSAEAGAFVPSISNNKRAEGRKRDRICLLREIVGGFPIRTVYIKGDSAALCYWNVHEKSKETFAGDWCTTGDQFHVDPQGYYWYHGRTDDMLKVSGVFVAPAEIENCLLQHEAVLECTIVGHDAGDGLVKPKALIVLRSSHSPSDELADEIKAFVKSKLAIYKYPRWIEFTSDLPKNDRGKVDRKKLKASNLSS